MMKERGVEVPPEDESTRRLHVLDNGRRYLPYSQSGMVPEDLLLSGDEDVKFDFLTADEKVDELQMILQRREEELEHVKSDPQSQEVEGEKMKYLEAKVEELEKEK